jgi:hypothetical protein
MADEVFSVIEKGILATAEKKLYTQDKNGERSTSDG